MNKNMTNAKLYKLPQIGKMKSQRDWKSAPYSWKIQN